MNNKNEYIVTCIKLDESGKGVVKVAGKMYSVANILPNEKVKIKLIKDGKHLDAVLDKIMISSKDRVKPECKYYDKCGGCQLQHMTIDAHNQFKEDVVKKEVGRYGKVNHLISMDVPYYYRNKIHSTFASFKGNKIVTGIYEEYSHKVIKVDKCIIQSEKADPILLSLRDFAKSFKLSIYNEKTNKGFLRHALIRVGEHSKEVMLVLVTTSHIFPSKNNFIKALLKKHPEITTVVMNINNKKTSMVLGEREIILYGKGFIKDTLCDLDFYISPKSFYQVNYKQTEKLYQKALKFADLKGNEVCIDAYSGIGTISLIAAKKAKRVIGVELNREAFKNSIKNAKINKIKNVDFYNEDAGEFMVKLSKEKAKIDTVFMDPPRAGSDQKFLDSVIKLSPKKVVYISCNPITQNRDLKYLVDRNYEVKKIQPVDMFPWTAHVECVVLLQRKI